MAFLSGLVVLALVAILLDFAVQASPIWIFLTSALALIPLVALLGQATEQLTTSTGLR